MRESDYPALFQSSDKASLKAQRNFFRLLRAQLIIFLAASLISCVSWFLPVALTKCGAVVVAALISAGVFTTWYLRSEKPERVWFDCRAVAESTKSLAWRYMMALPPYQSDCGVTEANRRFVDNLSAIRKYRLGVEKHFAGMASSDTEISDLMRETRLKPFQERKALFINNRLEEQRTWYEGKATANKNDAYEWLTGVLIVQAVALILAIWRVITADVAFVFVSLLMTAASSMVAWTQAKRHEELVEPYALAAQELKELMAIAADVNDQQAFEKLVSEVEDCISREHTMWRARRSVRNPT